MKSVLLAALLTLASAGAFAKTVVIDVRTPQEYSAGHIPGALNIEYQAIGQRIGMAGVAKEDEVIVYCRSGRRSGIALDTLQGLGYKKVANYGGIDAARSKLQGK